MWLLVVRSCEIDFFFLAAVLHVFLPGVLDSVQSFFGRLIDGWTDGWMDEIDGSIDPSIN